MAEQRETHSNLETLTQELDDLLEVFCSDAQQKFCIDQHVATPSQMQHIRQTVQQVRRFIPVVGLAGGPNSARLHHTLTVTCRDMLALYDAACRQRHIRNMSEAMTHQFIADWHRLRQTYDDKTKENDAMSSLLDSVASIRKSWKSPDHVQHIIISLLTSQEPQPGMYLVTVDSQNYAQLGLKRKAVGSRQIVFETDRLSRDEQIALIANLCTRFSAIFMQNAQHYLTQIESQTHLLQSSTIARKLKRLHDCTFTTEHGRHASQEPLSDISSEGASSPRPHRASDVPSYRLATTIKSPSLIWYPTQDRDFPIVTMPTPGFIPAPWQWRDLLKLRRPYHALFFGLLKRRRRQQSLSANNKRNSRLPQPPPQPPPRTNLSSASGPDQDPPLSPRVPDNGEAEEAEKESSSFATLSVSRLCQHLCRVGVQFYQDVLNNVNMRYHQDCRILEGAGQDLIHIYMSLQLHQARIAMQRVLAILNELVMLDPNPTTSHVARETNSIPIAPQLENNSAFA